MNDKTKEIQKKAERQAMEDLFLPDPRFGRLADRYTDNFEHLPEDTDWVDRRFSSGVAEVDSPLKSEIVKFANEDHDAQRLLAEAGVRDQSAKSIFRTRTKKGKWQGTAQWDEHQKTWVFAVQREDGEVRTLFIHGPGPNDTDAAKVQAAGELSDYDSTQGVRVLGPDQVLLLQRIASQDPSRAFEVGLGLMFTEFQDEEGFNPYDVISHEEFQEPLRELTWVIFLGTSAADRLSSADSEKFKQFAIDFIGVRPWNLTILKAAFESYKNQGVLANLQALDAKAQQPQTVTAADLDNLTDEEIDSTYDSVSREYIRSLRRNRR